jgi:hypothetical protein
MFRYSLFSKTGFSLLLVLFFSQPPRLYAVMPSIHTICTRGTSPPARRFSVSLNLFLLAVSCCSSSCVGLKEEGEEEEEEREDKQDSDVRILLNRMARSLKHSIAEETYVSSLKSGTWW